MRPYSEIPGTPGGFLLLMAALLLMIAQAAIFLISVLEKKSRGQTLASVLHLFAGFLFFVVMLDSYDLVRYPSPKITRHSTPMSGLMDPLPWLILVLLEALSAGILLYQYLEYRRYRMNTVTPAAIRRTLDLLPEGICISSQDGTVRLTNLKMDALCRALTGERLSDTNLFRAFLKENGEDREGKRLLRTPKGEVWLFAHEELAIGGTVYLRINAIDVTACFRITEELRAKNAHLQQVRRRMKEASNLTAEMFIKQEEAAARTALHNELGQVLLMERRYIEHPETTDRAAVALMTRQMNRILLGERRMPRPESPDDLRQAIDMAGRIGVAVEVRGEPPEEGRVRPLLVQAVRECAANTVKHADGDRLSVEIAETAAETRITLTNNGMPPTGPVAESGGLLSLHRMVEEAGGRMTVRSAPTFCLTISVPRP